MSARGALHRIALRNFVTYKEVELFPGPNLNVIIGPNGTGKSTFVCAIILGLCGKTSVIGRAKKIGDFVRSGCQEATIELELYRQRGQNNVTITRIFNLECQSSWHIDRKPAKEKDVQELITSLNIQVDNLCQLLPQDRVQDFTKMDPQQLLRSTLSAVGGEQSVVTLDELINSRNQQRNIGAKLSNNSQTLEEQKRLNERLKTIIDAMQQRKEIERDIAICEKKKLWIDYRDSRERFNELTRDRKEAVKVIDDKKKRMAPLEQIIASAREGITRLEQGKLSANRELLVLKDKIKELVESANLQDYKLQDIERDFQEKLDRYRGRERELREARAKLDKLNTDRARMQETLGSAESVKMELAELMVPIRKTNAGIEAVNKDKLQVQYDLENNIVPQIRLYQNKIRNLEDVAVKRLEALRSYSEDCYQAVMWYRNNKELFQQAVYEPMVLEINFSDPKFSRYLENTVAKRDLVAFTFESSRDMNLFLKKVRNECGLRMVNAICSPAGNAVYQPPCPIEQLSYIGFYTYLVDTISAPDSIIRYLCKQYQIHKIPIGNQHTYNNSGKVPANITFFYTADHRFLVRTSAYSGVKSSTTIEIRSAQLLANSVDIDKLNGFNKQLQNFETQAESHKQKLRSMDAQLQSLESGLNEFLTRKKKIMDNVEKIKTISAQIRLQQKKMTDIESDNVNIEEEKRNNKKKQRDCVMKQCKILADTQGVLKSRQKKLLTSDMWKIKLDLSRHAIVEQETELREHKSQLRGIQQTLEHIERELTVVKTQARDKLKEAKQCSNNKLPQDDDFPYKSEFERLPDDISGLQAYCIELQTRIDCMEGGDDSVIREYEERELLIRQLSSELTNSSSANRQLEDKMNRLREQWLPPVEDLVQQINARFGEMFAKMNCAGEIKLERAGNEEDYDKYGISISVSFRNTEQMCQLNRHTQSGGERALSTALYLISLQRLSTVPFRCVDEINQGMDPINERKMFQLLVQVTTQCDNAQYFLLTPKLLANLEYNDRITVHTIMNGKRIMNYKKWKLDTFIENAHFIKT